MDRDVVNAAEALAEAADLRSGVVTREAAEHEIADVLGRFEATWGGGRGPDHAMIRALLHAGATVLVAVADDEGGVDASATPPFATPGALLGATLGFLGWNEGLHVHSHMNAVAPEARGHGIGLALKLRQRAIALAHGVDEIRWTFDPLIRRNAHLNLVRLGAEVAAYLPEFYGVIGDEITGADRSDRFEVRWRLDAPRVERALAGAPAPTWSGGERLALVADFEALRRTDPVEASRLRDASVVAFTTMARQGLRAELDAHGDYVFTDDDPDRHDEETR
ncbi:GNAT family N-acetyltransferase [Agromyces lapidis]|uniref:N-acetyltransferase domain-containing protein n=1 Tax=Agromyces lapidis TaxID=279574 RepID=A0ABV5SRT1_9MICO|nr:GNAT family N-acetyltransferase [Agromyces lapidis]